MKISKHAEERSKERNGFSKKTTERMAKKALETLPKGTPEYQKALDILALNNQK